MGALKDFLSLERVATSEMMIDDLRGECDGWRALLNMLPLEVIEWVIRLGEPFRIVNRKYEASTGVLTNVKFEATEFQLELLGTHFDAVRAERLLERKLVTIGVEACLYFEDIYSSQPYEQWQEEENLGPESLDVEAINGA